MTNKPRRHNWANDGHPAHWIDETGHTYGCLLVLEYAGREQYSRSGVKGSSTWLCECSCGHPQCKGRLIVRARKLRSGRQVSCGMLRANPEIRRAARMKTPAKRRRAIAKLGAAAKKETATLRQRANKS